LLVAVPLPSAASASTSPAICYPGGSMSAGPIPAAPPSASAVPLKRPLANGRARGWSGGSRSA